MAKRKEFEITEEMIDKAVTYIPLAEKISFATTIAQACMEKVDVSAVKIEADATFTLPQMVKENLLLKQMYLMEYLLHHYLKIDISDPFTVRDYDYYAESHPLNQLERFKSNINMKNKIFDMLSDFKELKKMLDTEIYNVKTETNDALVRFLASMTLLSDPETVKKLTEQLKLDINKLSELKDKKKVAATKQGQEKADVSKG